MLGAVNGVGLVTVVVVVVVVVVDLVTNFDCCHGFGKLIAILYILPLQLYLM